MRDNPSLIDLEKYHQELRKQRKHNIPRLPPPSIPSIDRAWTPAEMERMRQNRKTAKVIYEHEK